MPEVIIVSNHVRNEGDDLRDEVAQLKRELAQARHERDEALRRLAAANNPNLEWWQRL